MLQYLPLLYEGAALKLSYLGISFLLGTLLAIGSNTLVIRD
jgi:hypothetical protein